MVLLLVRGSRHLQRLAHASRQRVFQFQLLSFELWRSTLNLSGDNEE